MQVQRIDFPFCPITCLYAALYIGVFILKCDHGLCFVVPDAVPGDVGGGGGSRYELVITWEVNHQSYALVCYSKCPESVSFSS